MKFLKNYLVLIFACAVFAGIYLLSQKPKAGTIVLFNGTSSAGKTSFIKELQKIYGNSYEAVIGDKFFETYVIEHPMSESMTIDMYQRQILSDMFLYAKRIASQGKNVFVDTIDFDGYYDDYCVILNCNSVVKILVYCPLDVIVDRVEKRNKSGDEKEKRSIGLAFRQFPAIYKLQESMNEMVVDRIKTNRMQHAMKLVDLEARQWFKESGAKQEEFEKNEQFLNDFAQQFKLDTLKEIVLVPKHRWDLIVNTGTHSSSEIAKMISEYLSFDASATKGCQGIEQIASYFINFFKAHLT
jgi:chloramphenicol 3-O-phosphotransferase